MVSNFGHNFLNTGPIYSPRLAKFLGESVLSYGDHIMTARSRKDYSQSFCSHLVVIQWSPSPKALNNNHPSSATIYSSTFDNREI